MMGGSLKPAPGKLVLNEVEGTRGPEALGMIYIFHVANAVHTMSISSPARRAGSLTSLKPDTTGELPVLSEAEESPMLHSISNVS